MRDTKTTNVSEDKNNLMETVIEKGKELYSMDFNRETDRIMILDLVFECLQYRDSATILRNFQAIQDLLEIMNEKK